MKYFSLAYNQEKRRNKVIEEHFCRPVKLRAWLFLTSFFLKIRLRADPSSGHFVLMAMKARNHIDMRFCRKIWFKNFLTGKQRYLQKHYMLIKVEKREQNLEDHILPQLDKVRKQRFTFTNAYLIIICYQFDEKSRSN